MKSLIKDHLVSGAMSAVSNFCIARGIELSSATTEQIKMALRERNGFEWTPGLYDLEKIFFHSPISAGAQIVKVYRYKEIDRDLTAKLDEMIKKETNNCWEVED
ncbi:hypothetical protein ACFL08_05245 [Patescibacteria group bacterium]